MCIPRPLIKISLGWGLCWALGACATVSPALFQTPHSLIFPSVFCVRPHCVSLSEWVQGSEFLSWKACLEEVHAFFLEKKQAWDWVGTLAEDQGKWQLVWEGPPVRIREPPSVIQCFQNLSLPLPSAIIWKDVTGDCWSQTLEEGPSSQSLRVRFPLVPRPQKDQAWPDLFQAWFLSFFLERPKTAIPAAWCQRCLSEKAWRASGPVWPETSTVDSRQLPMIFLTPENAEMGEEDDGEL